MDRAAFFDVMRSEFGSLSQSQVDGTEALLDEGEKLSTPMNHMSYILSTSYHETAFTLEPIAEYGKGQGHDYGEPCPEYNDQVAYGRGYVQLTWAENYERADKECALNGDLLEDFDLALDHDIAAQIIFRGMTEGWFTGKKLDDYCNSQITDYYNARRIVNGTDKASTLAEYAESFEQALRAGKWGEPVPVEPEVPESGVTPEDGEHPPGEAVEPPQIELPHHPRIDYVRKTTSDEELESVLNEMGAKGYHLIDIETAEGNRHTIWERTRRT